MLEPASSCDERPIPLASEFDASQHAIEALIRAARRSKNSVVSSEQILVAGLEKRRCGHPRDIRFHAEMVSGPLQRGSGCGMRMKRRIVIAENCDSHKTSL